MSGRGRQGGGGYRGGGGGRGGQRGGGSCESVYVGTLSFALYLYYEIALFRIRLQTLVEEEAVEEGLEEEVLGEAVETIGEAAVINEAAVISEAVPAAAVVVVEEDEAQISPASIRCSRIYCLLKLVSVFELEILQFIEFVLITSSSHLSCCNRSELHFLRLHRRLPRQE